MKEEYIQKITTLMQQTEDLLLLDLIWQLLQKSHQAG